METNQQFKINRYIFLACIIVFALLLMYSMLAFLTAFLGSVILYVLCKPVMNWLVEKKQWKKGLAATIIIIVSFFIFLLPVLFAGGLLYKEVSIIVSNPSIIIEPLKELDNLLQQQFHITVLSVQNLDKIQQFAAQSLSIVVNTSLNFFTNITMMYFFLYFLLVNIHKIEEGIRTYIPFDDDTVKLFVNELVSQTISNAIGIPLIAIIHGLLGFIAYMITGIEQAAFLGVITAFASVIPVVGTALVWLPASLFLFMKGDTSFGIFLLLWGFIVIGLSDNLLRFLLAKKMADVHPVITVLGIIIGLKYFGITGLIFGPLIISYFLILLKIYFTEYKSPAQIPKPEKNIIPAYLKFPFQHKKKQ